MIENESRNEIQNENSWKIILGKIKGRGSGGIRFEKIMKFAKENCPQNDRFFMFLEDGLIDLVMKGILREKKHTYETYYSWNVKNKGRGKVKCLNDDCETILSIYNNKGGYCFRCDKERKIARVVSPWILLK
ncbi:MAG: hypothetical protein AAB411_00475 [Patescibacteria group bacterium]